MNATASAPEQGEGRIARSWRLTKTSWQVVREDRVILLLAILSTLVGAVGVAVIFGVAGFGSSGTHGHRHLVDGRVAIVALILAYPLMFVSTFFNTAIAAAAAAGLQGRRLSLGQALAVPASRVGQLAVWALLATIFGVVLEQLARRLPLAGAIVARVVGLAWSIASLFAIPILALDGGSAPHALKRSTALVKQRWGEGISGNVIVAAWTIIVMIPLLVVFVIGIAATRHAPAGRIAVFALAAAVFVALVALSGVVRQIFAVALYRYAAENDTSGPFHEQDLRAPFTKRHNRQS
ncbi:MAG TPA: DUF6159 family protein [Solirubrobacteraceae bacterium]|jgi:hypothetical protein|nr:DUF6159 family protein [Solirubrobacteraceae bacterium]